MLLTPLIFSFVFYIFILWAIGFWAERKRDWINSKPSLRKFIYILGFGAYCTSWTYYGSIESVSTGGMKFITVYLAPAISTFFWINLLNKMIKLREVYGVTNIPDMLSIIYGRSVFISKIITIFLTIGIVPYIALQLKSVTKTTQYVLGDTTGGLGSIDLIIALTFCLIIIFYGNKKITESKDNIGISSIIAFESLVKLFGLVLVGLFVVFVQTDGLDSIYKAADKLMIFKETQYGFNSLPSIFSWISAMVLSFFAFLFLPRQFFMSVVSNTDRGFIKTAKWGVPLYLFLINIFVVPIALYSMVYLGDSVSSDLYLLAIPFEDGRNVLSAIVYLGGYSAAAGMIVLEVSTIASMITNNLILPFFVGETNIVNRNIITVKRIVSMLLLGFSYYYMFELGDKAALISMGMISFACVYQLAPVILGGFFWSKHHQLGAKASLIGGFSIWLYTLYIPAFLKASPWGLDIIKHGLFGISILRPYNLLNISIFDPLSHCVFWSTIVGPSLYIYFCLKGRLRDDKKEKDLIFRNIDDKEFSTIKSEIVDRLFNSLVKYYPRDYVRSMVKEFELDLDIENQFSLNIKELEDLVKKVESKLFQDIGAIATDVEMKMILTSGERNELSQSRYMQVQRNIMVQEKLNSLNLMTSGFAHEINNPLNILFNCSKALKKLYNDFKVNDNEKNQNSIVQMELMNNIILKNSSRLMKINETMIKQSRPGSSKYESSELSVVIKKSIDNVYNFGLYKNSKIKVDFSLNTEKEMNLCPEDIERVFIAILENSLFSLTEKKSMDMKFSPSLSINLNFEDHQCIIRVKDNGIGVSPDSILELYTPFFTTKPTGKGNFGLGLTMINEIIYAHKGDIDIISKEGEFFEVKMTIPYL